MDNPALAMPFIGPRSRPFYQTRADGWPLCPVCEDDELWSHLNWNGQGEKPPMQVWIDAGLSCYACGYDSTRMQTPPALPPTPPSRFVKRGAYMLCLSCGFTSAYCRCASTAPAPPSGDGAESDLEKRARECMGGR